MKTPCWSMEQRIGRARDYLGRRLALRAAEILETNDMLLKSQNWPEYGSVFEAWHKAFWLWVDENTPPQAVEHLNGRTIPWTEGLPTAASQLASMGFQNPPSNEDDAKRLLWEIMCQERYQLFALFRLGDRGPEGRDPKFHSSFFAEAHLANELGIGEFTYGKVYAERTGKKRSEDHGDRRLKEQLLYCWIPCVLWACPIEDILRVLNSRYPRSQNAAYTRTAISKAYPKLKLLRSKKPLWTLE